MHPISLNEADSLAEPAHNSNIKSLDDLGDIESGIMTWPATSLSATLTGSASSVCQFGQATAE